MATFDPGPSSYSPTVSGGGAQAPQPQNQMTHDLRLDSSNNGGGGFSYMDWMTQAYAAANGTAPPWIDFYNPDGSPHYNPDYWNNEAQIASDAQSVPNVDVTGGAGQNYLVPGTGALAGQWFTNPNINLNEAAANDNYGMPPGGGGQYQPNGTMNNWLRPSFQPGFNAAQANASATQLDSMFPWWQQQINQENYLQNFDYLQANNAWQQGMDEQVQAFAESTQNQNQANWQNQFDFESGFKDRQNSFNNFGRSQAPNTRWLQSWE